MFKLGITGGIGGGKSLVCTCMQTLGIPVYYADKEARRLMEEDPALVGEMNRLFGENTYVEGVLNRNQVARQMFEDKQLVERVNALVHPVVGRDFQDWANAQVAPYVVEEAALLLESGAFRMMDMNVLVYAPVEIRIGRVMDRDGTRRSEVEQRMLHQMDEGKKMKLVDKVLYNDEMHLLLPQVVALHEEIINAQ